MAQQVETLIRRTPLKRERVLQAAVSLADDVGFRRSACQARRGARRGADGALQARCKQGGATRRHGRGHLGEIDPPVPDADWKTTVRLRVLSARRALQRHPWARQAIESRTTKTAAVLDYMDTFAGCSWPAGSRST